MSRRILVLGAGGQVGKALLSAAWPSNWTVEGLTRAQIDIADERALEAALQGLNPDLVINCAAYTAVDKAEEDKAAAFQINAEAPGMLARMTAQRGIALVHFSSDYVFDGKATRAYREDDPIHPLSVYGASKAAGEAGVRSDNPRHLILRTSWVYAPWGHNFLLTMLRLVATRDELRVVNDQVGAPTSALFIADCLSSMIDRLFEEPTWGTYHLTAAGQTSWFDFAAEIFRRLPKAPRLLPISTSDYAAPAPRPAFSVLDNGKIVRAFALRQSDWVEQLDQVWQKLAT